MTILILLSLHFKKRIKKAWLKSRIIGLLRTEIKEENHAHTNYILIRDITPVCRGILSNKYRSKWKLNGIISIKWR